MKFNSNAEKHNTDTLPLLPLFSSKLNLIIFLLIFMLAVVSRLYGLGSFSLSYDEVREFGTSQGTPFDIIQACRAHDSNPPFQLFLVRFISLFGESEFWLRLVPAISGIASIPLIYIFSKLLLNNETLALVASFFFSASFAQFRFSQELRPYSMAVFFSCLMLILFELALMRKEERKWKYYFSLAAITGIFTQYGIGILALSLNIILFLEFIRKRNIHEIIEWIKSQFLVLVSCIFLFFLTLRYHIGLSEFFSKSYLLSSFPQNRKPLYLFIFFCTNMLKMTKYFLAGLGRYQELFMLSLFLIGIFLFFARKNFKIILYVVLPLMLTFIFSMAGFYPFGATRQCLFLSVPFYPVVAQGFQLIFQKKLKVFAYLCVFAFSLNFILSVRAYRVQFERFWENRIFIYYITQISKYNFNRTENLAPVVKYLRENYSPGENIYVFRYAEPGFLYYYGLLHDKEIWERFYPENGWETVNDIFKKQDLPIRFGIFSLNADDVVADFEKSIASADKSWFVFDKFYGLGKDVIVKLERKYKVIKKYQSPNCVSSLYLFKRNVE